MGEPNEIKNARVPMFSGTGESKQIINRRTSVYTKNTENPRLNNFSFEIDTPYGKIVNAEILLNNQFFINIHTNTQSTFLHIIIWTDRVPMVIYPYGSQNRPVCGNPGINKMTTGRVYLNNEGVFDFGNLNLVIEEDTGTFIDVQEGKRHPLLCNFYSNTVESITTEVEEAYKLWLDSFTY